jgi:hypothetical protein
LKTARQIGAFTKSKKPVAASNLSLSLVTAGNQSTLDAMKIAIDTGYAMLILPAQPIVPRSVTKGRHSRLSGCCFTFLCQRVEVATARVQHASAYQLFNDIEDSQPFFRLVARCLEEYM